MARKIDTRWIIEGTLVAQTPLHIGGLGANVDTDMPLARDGLHNYYIPGTSLAGPLRMWCEQRFGEADVDKLWGFQNENGSDDGVASHVVIDDVPIDEQYIDEIRDGVGIDREWGGAAEYLKYDSAILPRGTKMPFKMALDIPSENQNDLAQQMIAALLQALEDGQIRLGASKSRGLGRVRLSDVKVSKYSMKSRDGVLRLLEGNGDTVNPAELQNYATSAAVKKPDLLDITIHWQPVEPVMVKAGYDGIAVDMLPLVSQSDGRLRLVLPGSGIKGAFRNQAERIIRTLLDIDIDPMGGDLRKRNLKALEVPLVTWLFGDRGRKQEKGGTAQKDSKKPIPGLSALAIDDCYAQNHAIEVEKWNQLMLAEKDGHDGDFIEALKKAGLEDWKPTTHVAIDRWLGGASEGALYSILEPHCVTWDPIRLTLDFERLDEAHKLPALALLLLVLRDFYRGWIPLGFATTRGMGSVQVTSIAFTADTDTGVAKLLHQHTWQGDGLQAAAQRIPELGTKWGNWLRDQRKEATQ